MDNNVKEALLELKNLAKSKRRKSEFKFIKIWFLINLAMVIFNFLRIVLFSKNIKTNLVSSWLGFTIGLIIVSMFLLFMRISKGSFVGIDFVEESKDFIIFDKNSYIINYVVKINMILMENGDGLEYIPVNGENFLEELNKDWYKEFKQSIKDKRSYDYTTLDSTELKLRKLTEQVNAIKKATRKDLRKIRA